jgi:hypothetical protein
MRSLKLREPRGRIGFSACFSDLDGHAPPDCGTSRGDQQRGLPVTAILAPIAFNTYAQCIETQRDLTIEVGAQDANLALSVTFHHVGLGWPKRLW